MKDTTMICILFNLMSFPFLTESGRGDWQLVAFNVDFATTVQRESSQPLPRCVLPRLCGDESIGLSQQRVSDWAEGRSLQSRPATEWVCVQRDMGLRGNNAPGKFLFNIPCRDISLNCAVMWCWVMILFLSSRPVSVLPALLPAQWVR